MFISLWATIKGKFNHLVILGLWGPDVQTHPSLNLGSSELVLGLVEKPQAWVDPGQGLGQPGL